jgi:hypothetical protein
LNASFSRLRKTLPEQRHSAPFVAQYLCCTSGATGNNRCNFDTMRNVVIDLVVQNGDDDGGGDGDDDDAVENAGDVGADNTC